MNKKIAIAIIIILIATVASLVAANIVISTKSAGGVKTIFVEK